MTNIPHILVVSNNSFSLTDSNGRTLGNMFLGWPKACIAQICISTDGANFEVCDKFYCISDHDILSAFVHFRKAKGHNLEPDKRELVQTGIKGQRKTATMALIRHLLWSCNRWKSKELEEWIDAFNPEAVMLQNGDSAFMLNIAKSISEERKIPLLMFNTEGYCLFVHDWMQRDKLSWLCFPIYKYLLRRATNKIMRRTTFIIHGNQLLKEDYDHAFGVPSDIVYTGSDFVRIEREMNRVLPKIVYLGNFGCNRPVSLAIVAKVLRSIHPDFKIDVYGNPRTEQQKEMLINSEGVDFHGAVPYEEVKEIMRTADVLLHVEGLDEKLQETLRYGFSTKIADCLSSGIPFLLFSQPEIACARYIRDSGAGWFASNEDELREQLNLIFYNKQEREKRLSRAKEIAFLNHNIEGCRNKFQKAVVNILMQ